MSKTEELPVQAFRVMDAALADVGRGIARLHPADMARLGLSVSDFVRITGQQTTIAKAAPLDAHEPESGLVLIDGFLRENAKAGISEPVNISGVNCSPAKQVTLAPIVDAKLLADSTPRNFFARLFKTRIDISNGPTPDDIRRAITGLPVSAGDRVRVILLGTTHDYRVMQTQPDDAVVIGEETRITLGPSVPSREKGPAVSYEDIGGLGKEIARVREMIELPLRHPEIFEQLGVEPPKGILFYGPPGCGKTLIARAVAHEAGCHFISVNGPEIIRQHYGESEAALRAIFEEAQRYPAAILFLDELDALAPSRDSVLGDVEKRVVAQLLALLDGLNSRGRIIVIAATNLPNNIDPALRRPGRLDREVGINPPDRHGRLQILQIHTRGMPLADDVDLAQVAAGTHGFLGADLAALCREAAMLCARNIMPSSKAGAAEISPEILAGLKVRMKHFELAQGEIDLTTTRQVFTETPDVSWDDVGGLEEVKQVLREAVEWPLRYAERFRHVNVAPPKGILLTGLPGTGKTLIAKALAHESEVNFISVKGPELLSKWVGESEKGIREIFKRARQAAPSIVFFDEIDTIVPTRGHSEGGGHVSERLVGQFLLEMDSMQELQGVVVLGATNRPDLIDSALLRPGRFDFILELPMPDQDTRCAILAVHCRERRLAADISLEELAQKTEGLSGADLDAFCRRAAMLAIRDSIGRESGDVFSAFQVERRHFDSALQLVSRQPGH